MVLKEKLIIEKFYNRCTTFNLVKLWNETTKKHVFVLIVRKHKFDGNFGE